MNQDAEARQHLQAALQADPGFEPARHMLAQLEGREPADPAVLQAGFDLPAGAPRRSARRETRGAVSAVTSADTAPRPFSRYEFWRPTYPGQGRG